jgi:hypothetical protein
MWRAICATALAARCSILGVVNFGPPQAGLLNGYMLVLWAGQEQQQLGQHHVALQNDAIHLCVSRSPCPAGMLSGQAALPCTERQGGWVDCADCCMGTFWCSGSRV